jgi:predicted RNA-binding Zn-ribbon protein involved in translation (DUF1610 family)
METPALPKPTKQAKVIDLVREAGVDVSDWANFKGGEAKAGANPKYCYNWSFVEPGKVVVLNLWYPELSVSERGVTREFNLLEMYKRERQAARKRRAEAMNEAISTAYMYGLPIRVILLDGFRRDLNDPSSKASKASKRALDPIAWAVTSFDHDGGDIVLTRGATPVVPFLDTGDAELEGFEGQSRQKFIVHRQRERKLRTEKLEEAARKNGGRLVCEVPNCGFDFFDRYGELGQGYAQVHHLIPLSHAPSSGRTVRLEDLAVVCANCHAMIHRNGECRRLEEVIPPKRIT